MKLVDSSQIPERKRKPKATPLDDFEAYIRIKELILNGNMVPHQQVGILFDKQDCEALGMKEPWRTVADRIRKMLRESELERDYEVIKYETTTPGEWFVRITYKPDAARAHGNRKRE